MHAAARTYARSKGQGVTRRGFIRTAGLAALAGAIGTACNGGTRPTGSTTPSTASVPAAGTASGVGTAVGTVAPSPSVAGIPAGAAAQGAAALQGIDYAKIAIAAEKLAGNVFALTGSPGVDPGHPEAAGGRIGVLTGSDGVLIVDAQYAPLSGRVVAAIKGFSPAPIRFLVNTHEHPDHTGGNANFAHLGALILARQETRAELAQPLPAGILGDAANVTDPLRLPAVTYGASGPVTLHLNGETVLLLPAPSSHTDGDTIVWFQSADVLLIGDFYRNYGYPFVDPAHGGSTTGIVQALDLVSGLSGGTTKLVPGHGGIAARADLAPYRELVVTVQGTVKQLVEQGMSLQEVLAAHPTVRFDASVPGGTVPIPGVGTSADRFVSTIYAELKAGRTT